jgi:hypothetical protein
MTHSAVPNARAGPWWTFFGWVRTEISALDAESATVRELVVAVAVMAVVERRHCLESGGGGH